MQNRFSYVHIPSRSHSRSSERLMQSPVAVRLHFSSFSKGSAEAIHRPFDRPQATHLLCVFSFIRCFVGTRCIWSPWVRALSMAPFCEVLIYANKHQCIWIRPIAAEVSRSQQYHPNRSPQLIVLNAINWQLLTEPLTQSICISG